MSFVFFGTDEFAVQVLQELKNNNFVPDLIITTPGNEVRGVLQLSPVETWATNNQLPFSYQLPPGNYELFIVASYGKILPQSLLDQATHGTLNIHPSLLPKYRGSSPLQTAILGGDKETGVTIIQLDEKMDHGPVLAQEKYELKNETYKELRDALATQGAKLLAQVLPDYLAGKAILATQDHTQATFTKKFTKAEAELKSTDSPEINYRKVLALNPEPGTWLIDNNVRLKIKSAHLIPSADGERLVFDRIIPEGKREMSWEEYQRGQNR